MIGELSRETGKLRAVEGATLFEASHRQSWPQARLFAPDEAGWLKALRLEECAPRKPAGPVALQEVLFPYLEAL